MNGRIVLKNMAFYGYHGHHPGETAQGQRFFVDATLTLDLGEAMATDELGATVDYGRVYAVCREIVEREKVKLLETLCHRLMTAILEASPQVRRVEVTVKKPSAPIPGVLDYVAVEACLERPGAK
ncbi:MAG: dihydroneopterin aldolase [Opitutaceae bacterium]